MTRLAVVTLIVALASGAAACADDAAGGGPLQVAVHGGDATEQALPASLTDGWTIVFDRFLVYADTVSAAGLEVAGAGVYDLAERSSGQGQVVARGEASGGAVGTFSVAIARTVQDPVVGNVTTDDARVMAQRRHAIFIEGTATKAATTKTFAWGFDVPMTYTGCATGAVVGEGVANARLVIHPDRGFWPTLDRAAPRGVFDDIAAADGDGNGVITQAELQAVDITTLSLYDRGGHTDVTTLFDFLATRFADIAEGDAGPCQ